MTQDLTVRKSITINAPATEIWEALTDAEMSPQYMFGAEVVSDFGEGDKIVYKIKKDGEDVILTKGRITELVPYKILTYTVFDPNSGHEDVSENYSKLKWELLPDDTRTVVKINQGDFAKLANGEQRFAEADRLWDQVLRKLKNLIENS